MAEPDGSIYWFNKRWYDCTGTDLATVQGWGWRDGHHPNHIARVISKVQDRWAAGEPWEGTYLLRSAGGDCHWFLTRAEPIRNGDGSLLRWVGTNTDITEHREIEARHDLFLTLSDRLGELAEPREMALAAVEVL